ncbi:hypothetical protein [Rhodopirellula bahusiensis]|uniref:hypothetical protein n=1 Tax=Rhodopirellula bahusiensis TaxID=2014065 RepID=UPI0026C08C99
MNHSADGPKFLDTFTNWQYSTAPFPAKLDSEKTNHTEGALSWQLERVVFF